METRITYSGRIAYLDSTRVIAILAVILLHSSTMFLNSTQGDSVVVGSILNSISRFGVPCFVMISGALFLDENRSISIRSIFGKYVTGIIWLIVIWNIIYAISYTIILPCFRGGYQSVDYKIFIARLVFSEGHMWFLYMIVWLYIITPILRQFVNHANLKYVKYFIVLGLIMCFSRPLIVLAEQYMPFNTSFLTWLDNFHADFIGGFTVYYLTGWYLHNYELSAKVKNYVYAISVASIATVILLVNVMPVSMIDTINGNGNILIYLYSCGAYLWLQRAVFPRWVASLAPLVFGIYIIHPILIFLFNEYMDYANSTAVYLLKWIVVSILATVVVYMFSKVKILRNIIKA